MALKDVASTGSKVEQTDTAHLGHPLYQSKERWVYTIWKHTDQGIRPL